MDAFSTIVEFFQSGGVFMYPIVAVLVLGAGIATERWLYLAGARLSNRRAWAKLEPLLQDGQFRQAGEMAAKSKTALAGIIAYGIHRVRARAGQAEIEMAMEEGMMELVPRLEKRTHYLATFANIATLLGLLGTIIGLIEAFTAVSSANPAEKADLLSASISVAMNTTAFGLMVGIPLLLVHSVLQARTTELVDSLEMVSVKFVNLVSQSRREAAARVAASTPRRGAAQGGQANLRNAAAAAGSR